MSQPDQTSLEKQLLAHCRRLAILETQLAAKGKLNADPQLIIEIEDLRKIIDELSGAPPSRAAQTYLRALNELFDKYRPTADPVELDFKPGPPNPYRAMSTFQQQLMARYRAEQELQPHYAPSPDINAKKTNVEKFLIDNKRVFC